MYRQIIASILILVFTVTPMTMGHAMPHDHGRTAMAAVTEPAHSLESSPMAMDGEAGLSRCCAVMPGHCTGTALRMDPGQAFTPLSTPVRLSPDVQSVLRGIGAEAETPPPRS